MKAARIFKACVEAIRAGELIQREARKDKEFHFQNWFERRLDSLQLRFDSPGRNSYPDFRLVQSPEGYELKALAYPGRDASYDSNSRVPCGEHNGRQVYYVFGRYPKEPDGDSYPVLDFVLCHGSFLNADHTYVHENKSFRGFGSYGDILVRDRKMYVAPTPFALVEGTEHLRTLILPSSQKPGRGFVRVGTLRRREADELVVAYRFDLRDNELTTVTAPNPHAGREHVFEAYRLAGDRTDAVTLRSRERVLQDLQADGGSDAEQ